MITICDCCQVQAADIHFNCSNLCFECAKKAYPVNPVPLDYDGKCDCECPVWIFGSDGKICGKCSREVRRK